MCCWKQCGNRNETFYLLSKDSPLVVCQLAFHPSEVFLFLLSLFLSLFLFLLLLSFSLLLLLFPLFSFLYFFFFYLFFFLFFPSSALAITLFRNQRYKVPSVEKEQFLVGNVTANMRCPKADVGCFGLPYNIVLILDRAPQVLSKLYSCTYSY